MHPYIVILEPRRNYTMIQQKENNSYYECKDYIRYLYNEGVRQGIQINPNFYPELIKFAKSHEGRIAYDKFMSINPGKLGIAKNNNYTPKRIFTS